jgi:hypothetical protein
MACEKLIQSRRSISFERFAASRSCNVRARSVFGPATIDFNQSSLTAENAARSFSQVVLRPLL